MVIYRRVGVLGLQIAAIAAFSAVSTGVLGLYARPIGQWLGVMDMPSGPDGHKRHSDPTPAVGGFIAGLIGALALLAWPDISNDRGQVIRFVSTLAVMITMIIGFIDDRRHISAVTRLFLGVAVSTLLLILVPELRVNRVAFPSINLSIGLGYLALPFTVLCLLALKNAVNMADGRNGLLLGMAIIWNCFFLYHGLSSNQPTLIATPACFVVLFAFNWHGKLFMGDCGAYGIATFFGILALASHKDTFGVVRTAEITLLFLIPMLDTGRLIAVRIASGRSPLAPDGRHLHHLLDKALGWRRGWLVYMALIAVPLVVYQMIDGYGVHIIVATTVCYGLIVWMSQCRSFPDGESNPSIGEPTAA